MNENRYNQILEAMIRGFWIFIIGSVAGCIIETIVGIFQNGLIEIRQGLVYGPFVPVYGLGLVIYYFSVTKVKSKKMIFLISMLLGGMTEYIFSYLQESAFGTVSWDYSRLWLNIHGRTSLLHCIYWGGFGIIFVKYLLPVLSKFEKYAKNVKFQVATIICIVIMSVNIGISYLAGIRNYERKLNMVASNKIEEWIDENYPEEFVDKLFAREIKIEGQKGIFEKMHESFR